jgi:hypothetical protein
MSSPHDAEDRDARFERVVADYLHAAERGLAPDQAALIAEHPKLAEDLQSFFANRAAMERVAAPIRNAGADEPTIGLAPGTHEQHSKPRIQYVGDYELVEEIARGGMGIVYRAKQKSLNRSVAVKMILAGQLADDSAVRRFKQEAEAAASLDHPHIVPIYEVGEHEGRHYFSMGLVEGMSLAQRIASGPMPTREAAELVRTLAIAVQYAHERNIIHRDLKPANILLDTDGRPRITDFGLAKRTVEGQSLTETGQVLGTPGYMPPEQVQAKDIGPAADVYSLGAILYALLTGRPPFVAATPMETMLQVLAAEPVSPRQLNPSVPRDLDTVVMKCLEKQTTWRYRSAQELADELNRFLAGEPIRARRPGLVEQGARWLAKQKRSVALGIGVAAATAAVLVGGIGGWILYQKSLEGRLGLDTEHNRLIAQVLTPAGEQVLPPFTVPTQQPVELPAGEYLLRASGKELLSDDLSVRIEKGQTQQLSLSLNSQVLWTAQNIAGTAHVVHSAAGRPVGILDLHEKGIRFSDPSLKQELWSRNFDPLDDPLLKAIPGYQWKWAHWDILNSGYGQYDRRPQILEPCPRLDDDQLGDVVLAGRHQPVVVALSTDTGKILWAYAPQALAEAAEAFKKRATSGPGFLTGTIAGQPLVIPDVDGDGTVDLVISATVVILADGGNKMLPQRVIDGVSGKTGKRLWSYSLPEEWFILLNVPASPLAVTWHAQIRGYSGTSETSHPFGNTFRDFRRNTVSADSVTLPYPLQSIRHNQRSVVSCVAGTRVLLLDPQTGREVVPPQRPTYFPNVPPRVARFEAKGDDSLLLSMSISESGINIQPHDGQGLALWSPAQDKPHWQYSVFYSCFEKDLRQFQPRPVWPLVADLNGDGVDEVIMAHASSLDRPYGFFHTSSDRAWGEIVLLGKEQKDPFVWKRRLETVDQQVDQFIAGSRHQWRWLAGLVRRQYFLARVQFRVRVCRCHFGQDGRNPLVARAAVQNSEQPDRSRGCRSAALVERFATDCPGD